MSNNNNKLPSFLYSMITESRRNINLRNNTTVTVPRARSLNDSNQVDYKLAQKINQIDHRWIQVQSQKTLKTKLKKEIISAYRDSVICNSPMCMECQVLDN